MAGHAVKGRSLIMSDAYDARRAAHSWSLPARLNMAQDACTDWALRDPERVAIIDVTTPQRRDVTYRELEGLAGGIAHHLTALGVQRGARVAVFRGQSFWTAAAHLAIWKIAAISVPLFTLFGSDAILARLSDSEADAVISDSEGEARLRAMGFDGLILVPERADIAPRVVEAAQTLPDDPAVLIYTSGTTGAPKGALHGQRMLRGHLPGVEMAYDLLPQPGDVLWTPADWAWIGGFFDVLMPGLHLGVPVVAGRLPKFTSAACIDLIAQTGANCLFLPPTALRRLKADDVQLPGVRAVCSGGEPLGAELLSWAQSALGVTVNEIYGQTECNLVIGSCSAWFVPHPGCLGKPVPGHRVAVIDEAGTPCDHEGDIAVARGTPVMMLEYWKNPGATQAKFRGDWLLTGDRGIVEADGFIRFLGREDDVITSAGYRIGPSEIEDCLIQHPLVQSAGVVGKPDPERTEAVCAFVVLRDPAKASASLAQTLIEQVKTRVGAHQYPRELHFLDDLPMTITGKIRRRDLRALAVQS